MSRRIGAAGAGAGNTRSPAWTPIRRKRKEPWPHAAMCPRALACHLARVFEHHPGECLMPRIRSIKPSFFRSEDVSALPLRARLTWIGLWTQCDDQGRAKDNAKLIKGDIWPLDSVNLRDIEEDLATLAAHQRIVRYEVDGKRYLEIVNWHAHQAISKPSPSRIPPSSDGRILTSEEPPEDLDDEPEPDPSDQTPVGLPEDSGRTPAGKGKERKGGEGKGGDVRASAGEAAPAPIDPGSDPPPIRCPDHVKTLDPPPCRACRTARELRERWDLDRVAAAAAAQSGAARERAEAARAAINACDQCDSTGYLSAGQLCHHDPANSDRVNRGLEAARAGIGSRPRPRNSAPSPGDNIAEASARRRAAEAAHKASTEEVS